MSGGRKAVKVKRVLMFPKPYFPGKAAKAVKAVRIFHIESFF